MNLQGIDDFIVRVSAGWKPFGGNFKISKHSFRNNPLDDMFGKNSVVGKGYRGISDLGDASANAVGYTTTSQDAKNRNQAMNAASAAAAQIKQQEYQASAAEGLARLAMKRRRGFGASMMTNQLGSSSVLG